MAYILPKNISPNKIFITNRSGLEGRIDPNPYHFERISSIERLKENNELLKLSEIVKSVKTITNNISENKIYIGLENIVSNTGEYIPSENKQSISSAGVFKKGQILFPKLRPYLNKVYLAEFDGICSTEFHIFECPVYRNEFLTIYLRSNLIVNQTKHLMTGNTLPRLQTEDINRLPVPKISLDRQDEIIELYRESYTRKQQKDAKAKLLLASIDAYLLNELGIILPEKDDNIQKRIFATSFNELAGERFDPEMNLYKKEIRHFKYETIELKNLLLKPPQYGANESGIPRKSILEPRYIRITDIDEYGRLNNEIGVTAEKIEKKYILNNDDILFARSGATAGKCYLHKSGDVDYPAFFAGYMIRFVVNSQKILPEYLFFYTQSRVYKEWAKAIQRSAGQPNINAEEYKSLLIPLPSIEEQRKIVEHVSQIHSQATILQEDAISIIKNIEKEIEGKLLGSKT